MIEREEHLFHYEDIHTFIVYPFLQTIKLLFKLNVIAVTPAKTVELVDVSYIRVQAG